MKLKHESPLCLKYCKALKHVICGIKETDSRLSLTGGERQLRLNMLLPSPFFFGLSCLSHSLSWFFFDLSKFKDIGLLILSLSLTPEIDNRNQKAWFALKFDLFTGSKVLNTIKSKLILKGKEIVNPVL